MERTVIMNIGLTDKQGQMIEPIKALRIAMSHLGGVYSVDLVEGEWEGKPEKTLVVYAKLDVGKTSSAWFEMLSRTLEQDCIAVFYPEEAYGRLYWADEPTTADYPLFDKSKFKL